ncbi:MAG: TfoX/Sxy family protein, partial [Ignavibacteria bacterium]|nr:TfoX/Sxy family protein [Ignavibacteria bacterium]
ICKVEEKIMMGGLTFMVNNKMCGDISGSDFVVRTDSEIYDSALKRKGCGKCLPAGRQGFYRKICVRLYYC